MKPLLLDANNIAKRCIFASAMDDRKAGGIYTGGVFGTLNLVSRLLERFTDAGPVIAAWDEGIPMWRRHLVPGYKANRRPPLPGMSESEMEKVLSQMLLIAELFNALGVVSLRYKEREADDTLGALAQILPHSILVSSDRDLYQCVNYGASMWIVGKEVLLTRGNFQEVTGIPPEKYLFYRMLVGDSSDGLAGAVGCGEKRAAKVVAEFAGLHYLEEALRGKSRRTQWEQRLIEDVERLRQEMCVISLGVSFGSTAGLVRKLQASKNVAYDEAAFMHLCRRLQLHRVSSDRERYRMAFTRASAGWASLDIKE
jgi:DNA polymerase-1